MTHVANSGTLCTLASSGESGLTGAPFGSHVDYVLDEQVSVRESCRRKERSVGLVCPAMSKYAVR